MNACISIVTCKYCRPLPWKKCLKNLYPSQTTGYEGNIEAQNAEELAKHALRNNKLFVPISKYCLGEDYKQSTGEEHFTRSAQEEIRVRLKTEYYIRYVSISINAFITLIDMCHDNLSRFETFVYRVVISC